MAKILNIETTTKVCSVSIGIDGVLKSYRENKTGNSHSELITTYIQEIIEETNITLHDIDAVAVSKGPGSYTGLRIGVSTAKGLCYALDKPLLAISTLHHISAKVSEKYISQNDESLNILLCPMIDARRMEVYAALFNVKNEMIREIQADIVDENTYKSYLQDNKIFFFGDGAEKCKDVLRNEPNALFLDNIYPSAIDMIALSEVAFKRNLFEDLAYFEPFYLKDFVAGKPRVKGL